MKNNKSLKVVTRIVAMLLAALMLISTIIGGLSLMVSAAGSVDIRDVTIGPNNGNGKVLTGKMVNRTEYSLNVSFIQNFSEITVPVDTNGEVTYKSDKASIITLPGQKLSQTGETKATVKIKAVKEGNVATGEALVTLYVNTLRYSKNGDAIDIDLKIKGDGVDDYIVTLKGIDIYEFENWSSDSDSSSNDDITTYTPDIKVENVLALDSKDNRIDEVTKDTPPFTLEIVYADMGLHKADLDKLKSGDMKAYITDGSGLLSTVSNKGVVRLVSSEWDYPRFRVRFSNVVYDGTSNKIAFESYYLFDDLEDPVKGSGAGSLYAAKSEEDDKDKEKMGIAVPKIIINNYSYGQDAIVAGSEFTLNFSVLNTSTETPLENIVVTLTPTANEAAKLGPGLIVASSSNTIYEPTLAAGAEKAYSVAFQARPDAEVTSHLINITFSYEYIDTQLEKRERVPDLSESIAIPVSQIDRFTVDPISETPYGSVKEEIYLTVNFVNRGKSTTYNISGKVSADESIVTAPQHFGNLEAGKSDMLEFSLVPSMPGSFNGEIIIEYEDENSNTKEISVPFEMTVEEPYYPPMEPDIPPIDPEINARPQMSMLSIILSIVGALAIATPLALYVMKRVKAKGSEESDEFF